MSKIIFAPEIVEGRYIHFSFKGESCAIRDFIATGDRPCRDYATSQVEEKIVDWFPADRVPIADRIFWFDNLVKISQERLGEKAVIVENGFKDYNYSEADLLNDYSLVEPNHFTCKKPEVLFYGERGVVNTFLIELSQNVEALNEFIHMVRNCDGGKLYEKEVENYNIVIEPDFGKVGFGTVDAAITINGELLILFEAKRCSFNEVISEITYQIELNYALGKHLTEISGIPSEINIVPVYSSDINRQRGQRGGEHRRLKINDEHRFFFNDFVKGKDFSCLTLTTDKSEAAISNYYRDIDGIKLENLSWISYDSLKELMEGYGMEWFCCHMEMNRRHLGF